MIKPENNDGSESDGGQEECRIFIGAGRNTAPFLQPPEHDLDAATAPVAALVAFDGLEPGSLTRDARLDALGL